MKNLTLANTLPIPISNTDWNVCADLIVNKYQDFIRQMDISKKSIGNYISHAAEFVNFVGTHGLNFNSLVQFKKHLQSVALIGTGTKRLKLFIAIRIIKELQEYGLIDRMKTVKNFPRNTGHVKDGINAEEVELIKSYIASIPNKNKRLRINAMFVLMALEGLRTFEVCNLEVKDIDLKNKTIKFLGKKRSEKELKFIINDATIKALQSYTKAFKKHSGYLFTSVSNNSSGQNKPIKETALRQLFNGSYNTVRKKFYPGIFQKSGVDGRTVHGLRHYFITTVYDSTKDTVLTMKAGRLKSLQTVINYKDTADTRKLFAELQKAFE